MQTTPLFRDQDVMFISALVDKAVKAKGFLEIVDGPASSITLRITSNAVSPKIPEEIKVEIHEFMDEVIEGDYPGAGSELADFLASKIDIPLLDEGSEKMVLTGAFTWIIGLLKLPEAA